MAKRKITIELEEALYQRVVKQGEIDRRSKGMEIAHLLEFAFEHLPADKRAPLLPNIKRPFDPREGAEVMWDK